MPRPPRIRRCSSPAPTCIISIRRSMASGFLPKITLPATCDSAATPSSRLSTSSTTSPPPTRFPQPVPPLVTRASPATRIPKPKLTNSFLPGAFCRSLACNFSSCAGSIEEPVTSVTDSEVRHAAQILHTDSRRADSPGRLALREEYRNPEAIRRRWHRPTHPGRTLHLRRLLELSARRPPPREAGCSALRWRSSHRAERARGLLESHRLDRSVFVGR